MCFKYCLFFFTSIWCIVIIVIIIVVTISRDISLLWGQSEAPLIIEDIIVDKSLRKRRWSLLELALAISVRHCNNYLWSLTQYYLSTPTNLGKQAKPIFVWNPKERTDLKMINDEINVLADDELVIVRDFWNMSNDACLYKRN